MGEFINSKNNRSGSIDLFRIVAMLMVVVLHLLGHGGVLSSLEIKSTNWFVLGGLESICIIAVNCFALTTGFLYVGKKIKIKNILNLYLQVLSFSLIITICFFALGKQPFDAKTFVSYLFPILSGRYWYFSAYFILYLMMPLLNIILDKVCKRFMFVVVIVSVVLFGVFSFGGSLIFGDVFSLKNGYSFVWLAILYLIGGTIKKYEIYAKLKGLKWFCIYLVSAVLSFVIGLVLSIISNFKRLPYIGDYTFLFNLLSSCFLLLFFASIKIKANKIISFLAKNSFGVYLLHEHVFIREAFITDNFVFISQYNPVLAVLIVLGIAMAIYALGIIVEFVRKMIFKLIRVDKLVEKIDTKIIDRYNRTSR